VLREIAGNICRTDAEVLAHRFFEQYRRLHDERDPALERPGVERSDVAAVESHRPRRRLDETVEAPEETRLPGPRRAHERQRATALHGEGDVIQDRRRGPPTTSRIHQRKMIDLEDRITHISCRG